MNSNIPKTEQIYKKSKPIDHLDFRDAISLMIKEQKKCIIICKKSFKINRVCNTKNI